MSSPRFSFLAMRFTRLRFILVRTFWISIIITILLQLFAHRNETSSSSSTDDRRDFWTKVFDDDRALTDDQRIDLIRSQTKITDSSETNWTNVLQENFARRLVTLNERDAKTDDKHRVQIAAQSQQLSQSIIHIYEETTVRRAKAFRSPRKFSFRSGFRSSKVLFVDTHFPFSMSLSKLSMDL